MLREQLQGCCPDYCNIYLMPWVVNSGAKWLPRAADSFKRSATLGLYVWVFSFWEIMWTTYKGPSFQKAGWGCSALGVQRSKLNRACTNSQKTARAEQDLHLTPPWGWRGDLGQNRLLMKATDVGPGKAGFISELTIESSMCLFWTLRNFSGSLLHVFSVVCP